MTSDKLLKRQKSTSSTITNGPNLDQNLTLISKQVDLNSKPSLLQNKKFQNGITQNGLKLKNVSQI